MSTRLMTLEDVQALLRKQCAKAGSQAAFAEAHDLSRQFISAVLKGNSPPSEYLCEVLGVREVGRRWAKR